MNVHGADLTAEVKLLLARMPFHAAVSLRAQGTVVYKSQGSLRRQSDEQFQKRYGTQCMQCFRRSQLAAELSASKTIVAARVLYKWSGKD